MAKLKDKGEASFKTANVKRDGALVRCSVHVSVFNHFDFKDVWVMTLVDITEKKKLEELISERDTRYQILFEGSTDAALVITTDGIILHANQSACKLFGWTEKELRLMGRKGIVDMNDPRLTELLISRSNARAHSGNLTCIRSSGERFEAEISSVNYRDIDNNELVYVIAREIIKNPARRSGDKRDHFVGGNGSEV